LNGYGIAVIGGINIISATQSDNAAFDCNDEENTKEEEVYQDLCAIQNNIARNQVHRYFSVILS
jgi:hypothetical protein